MKYRATTDSPPFKCGSTYTESQATPDAIAAGVLVPVPEKKKKRGKGVTDGGDE